MDFEINAKHRAALHYPCCLILPLGHELTKKLVKEPDIRWITRPACNPKEVLDVCYADVVSKRYTTLDRVSPSEWENSLEDNSWVEFIDKWKLDDKERVVIFELVDSFSPSRFPLAVGE